MSEVTLRRIEPESPCCPHCREEVVRLRREVDRLLAALRREATQHWDVRTESGRRR